MTRVSLALLLLALLLAAPADGAQRKVPRGWLGVTADGPMTAGLDREWSLMVRSGAETVRAAVRWNELQPDRAAAPDLSTTDALVAAAARRGLRLLPVLQGTPAWAAARPSEPASPPRDPADFGAFTTALIARYGPQGTFWDAHPELPRIPVRTWQLYNEPNLDRYWSEQPFARSYVALLRAGAAAIRAADPGATVVLAGLPNESWTALRKLYRAGARGHFDAVALHPYTGKPRDVLRLVRYARREMERAGDRRVPVWITELSWPAARGRLPGAVGFATTDRGQARRLGAVLRLLEANRREHRITRVFWYTWLSAEQGPSAFDWSGLRRLRDGAVVSTPALRVYRRWARRLEGCVKAPDDARRCA